MTTGFPAPSVKTTPRAAVRSRALRLLAVVVLLGYVAGVEALLGWRSLGRTLLAAGAAPLLWVLAAVLGSYGLRVLRLRALLDRRPPALTLLALFSLYNAANWLMPARLGEASLPLLLQRRLHLPLVRGAGVLLWLRLLDLHVLAVLSGLLLALQFDGPWRVAGLVLLVTGLFLPRGLLLVLQQGLPRRALLVELLSRAPGRARPLAIDLLLAWAAWGWKLSALGVALSMLAGLTYAAAVLGALGGDVAGVLPLHAPLGAGSYEAGVLLAVSPWQPALKATLAGAVQLHALMLAVVLLLGLLSLPALRGADTDER